MLRKILAGGIAGAIGSSCGNPFDILKTRMMAYEGTEPHTVRWFANRVY